MKSFWDERYAQNEFAYGVTPVIFFRDALSKLEPGRILLPGDGEGRNAVFAASQGWEVEAFDFSVEGKNKALGLAEQEGVSLNYTISNYQTYQPKPSSFDAIGLFYTHLPSEDRSSFHMRMIDGLKPGGHIIMQVFSKDQLDRSSGPKHLSWYSTLDEIKEDFKGLTFELLEEVEEELDEGPFHQGIGSLIRIIARR